MNVHRTLFRPSLAIVFATATFFCPVLCEAQSKTDVGIGLLSGDASWPRWQGRLGLASDDRDPATDFAGNAAPRQSLSLFGDYYFLQQGLSPRSSYAGGFRATGGLIIGSRTGAWSVLPASLSELGTGFSAQRRSFSLWTPLGATEEPGANSVPYLGVGYTGLKSLRATGGGWSFSADVGLVALQPRSAVRFGQQSTAETLRELQLSPLLQLGVSYAF